LIQSKYASISETAFIINLLALGLLFGLLWYNVFLAVSTKEKMFFYFSLIMVLLTVLQTFSAYERFFFQLNYNKVTVITHLLFMTFLLFFEELFSISEHDKKLSRCNMVNIWVIGGYALLFLLLKALFPLLQGLHTAVNFIRELFVFYTNALFLYTIVRAIAWMRIEAILILIAFIPPAFITSVNAMNIFPFMYRYESFVTFLMQYNQPIGLSLQAVLFSLAVGNRYNRLKLEQQNARQEHAALSKLHEKRTQFFLNMSHETRTPLTIILGLIRQVRQDSHAASVKQVDPLLAAVERNARILLRQVNNMLRLEQSKMSTDAQPISICGVVPLIVEPFLPIARKKGISLSYGLSKEFENIGVRIGQEDLESLLMNLLSNAIKYTQRGGSVRITVDGSVADGLRLSVADTGCGIPKEDQRRIFEQFEVVPDSAAMMQTGLGLPLVKHIMQGYKAEVLLQSEVARGSTFTLVFPSELCTFCVDKEKEDIPMMAPLYLSEFSRLESDQAVIQSLEAPTILIVEDNADLRWYVQSIVSTRYRCLTASSAQQALSLLQEHRVDLIISDVMMPAMDGHALLKQVKQYSKEDPIPLIFLTARDCMEEKIEALKEGAIRYITKPFEAEVLLAVVDSILTHDKLLKDARNEQFRQKLSVLLEELERPVTRTEKPMSLEHLKNTCKLSEREMDVLRLIVQGKSDKEIASALTLSVKTVANHNRNIYSKCSVNGRYELLSKLSSHH
jgi:signal transduction histidine kinase/DNA-binding NarL/FixJ family response regulator